MPDETPSHFRPGPGSRQPTSPGTPPFGAPVPPRPFQPVPPGAPGTPGTEKKRHPVLTHGAVALVALFLGVGIGAAGGGSSDGKTGTTHASGAAARPAPTITVTAKARPARTVTVTATPKPVHKPAQKAAHKTAAKAGPATSFAGDGEYRVGKDIAAGTYRTAGPQDTLGCYWERDKDSSGDFGSIIANDNLNGSGLVTVRTGENFKTERCRTWKRVG
jgi:hypothetical protein